MLPHQGMSVQILSCWEMAYVGCLVNVEQERGLCSDPYVELSGTLSLCCRQGSTFLWGMFLPWAGQMVSNTAHPLGSLGKGYTDWTVLISLLPQCSFLCAASLRLDPVSLGRVLAVLWTETVIFTDNLLIQAPTSTFIWKLYIQPSFMRTSLCYLKRLPVFLAFSPFTFPFPLPQPHGFFVCLSKGMRLSEVHVPLIGHTFP